MSREREASYINVVAFVLHLQVRFNDVYVIIIAHQFYMKNTLTLHLIESRLPNHVTTYSIQNTRNIPLCAMFMKGINSTNHSCSVRVEQCYMQG